MSLKQKTISGVKWTTVSTFTIAFVSILKLSVLARFLDASDFGLMALVTFVLGFMGLFMDAGLSVAILHRQEITKKEYASLYWVNVLISFFLFGVLWLISPVISSFYQQPELNVLIPLASVGIIFSAAGRQFKTIEQKKLNFRYIAFTDIFGGIVSLLVGIVLAVKGYGVYALIFAVLTKQGLTNIIYLIQGLATQGMILYFRYSDAKPFLKIGYYQVGGQVVNYFNRDIDILLIGKFFGADVLGGYSLAKQLVQRPMQIINPIITKVAGPVLALIQNDKKQLRKKFLTFLNVVATANFTAYSLIVLLAYPIVLIIYGSEFLHIVALVQLLSVYMFIRSVRNPVGGLVIATGRTDLDFFYNLFVLLVMPVAILVGSQFSVEMVAVSLIIVVMVITIPFWKLLIHKMCGASLYEFLISHIPSWKKFYLLVLK